MLLDLYSTETIMDTELGRKVLSWYARFDIFAGLMSGYETSLGREWLVANEVYYRHQTQRHPGDINHQIGTAVATHRLMAMDMAVIFAKRSRAEITLVEFKLENERMSKRISDWKRHLNSLHQAAATSVQSFEVKGPSTSIIVPHMPGGFYKEGLSTLNLMLIDGLAIDIMHRYRFALLLKQPLPSELGKMALDLCGLVEAVDCWLEAPSGVALSVQAALALATLFLPKNDRYKTWSRQKLARIEGMG